MRNNNFITSPRQGKKIKRNKEFISIVLLSENHGYRMKSYGPVSLIKLEDSKTLIEKQINTILATFENFEIILCVGFESVKIVSFVREKFKDINIRIIENQIHYNSNCCESIRLCLANINNDKVIICGGGVLIYPSQFNLLDFSESMIIVQNQIDDSNFEIGVIPTAGNIVNRLCLGVKTKYWTEILFLHDQNSINYLLSIVSDADYKNKFMFEALNELVKRFEIKIQQNISNKPIIKIDNIKTLRKTTKI